MYVCVSESCHDQITEDADLGRKTDGLKREDSSLSLTHARTYTLFMHYWLGDHTLRGMGGWTDKAMRLIIYIRTGDRLGHNHASWPRHCFHLVAVGDNCTTE